MARAWDSAAVQRKDRLISQSKSPLNTKYSYADHLVGCDSPTPADAERIKKAFEKAGLSH